jgi:uncharacterized protein YlaI
MSLYDLPKDMLVILVSTIEKQTEERIAKEMLNKPLKGFMCDKCEKFYIIEHEWHFTLKYEDPHCVSCYMKYKDKIKYKLN